MIRRHVALGAAALAVLLVASIAGPDRAALAQGQGGGLPGMSREQIERMIREELDRIPDTTTEIDGVARITYKAIPTDPEELARRLPQNLQGQIPQGVDVSALIRQYEPLIQERLNEYMADFARFEALVDIRYRTTRIPTGTYTLGLAFEGARLIGATLSGEGLREPLGIRFETRALREMSSALLLELRPSERDEDQFMIYCKFAENEGLTQRFRQG